MSPPLSFVRTLIWAFAEGARKGLWKGLADCIRNKALDGASCLVVPDIPKQPDSPWLVLLMCLLVLVFCPKRS